MKQLISEVLQEKLEKATYQSDRASVLTKEIADAVKSKLKGAFRYWTAVYSLLPTAYTQVCWMRAVECNYARCKYVVQIVIGEQRGEGVRYGRRRTLLPWLSTDSATVTRKCVTGDRFQSRMGCRCFWDAETDCYASETFSNVRTLSALAHSKELIEHRSHAC